MPLNGFSECSLRFTDIRGLQGSVGLHVKWLWFDFECLASLVVGGTSTVGADLCEHDILGRYVHNREKRKHERLLLQVRAFQDNVEAFVEQHYYAFCNKFEEESRAVPTTSSSTIQFLACSTTTLISNFRVHTRRWSYETFKRNLGGRTTVILLCWTFTWAYRRTVFQRTSGLVIDERIWHSLYVGTRNHVISGVYAVCSNSKELLWTHACHPHSKKC